jgi:hypothetical protein
MATNDRKIGYLEYVLNGGLPLHRPLRKWPATALARLDDPATLSLLSDADLARLIEVGDDWLRDEGIDPATLPAAPISPTADIETSQRGRPPLPLACRCGLCERYRQSSG